MVRSMGGISFQGASGPSGRALPATSWAFDGGKAAWTGAGASGPDSPG